MNVGASNGNDGWIAQKWLNVYTYALVKVNLQIACEGIAPMTPTLDAPMLDDDGEDVQDKLARPKEAHPPGKHQLRNW